MPKTKIIGYAFLNAVVAAAYVMLVALFMTNFGTIVPETGILGPTAFLLTFVISAAVMGVVVFGRPVVWFLNDRKREAIDLVIYTIFFLIVIALIVFLTLTLKY